MSLSKGSKFGSSASMSATWSAGRPTPNEPDRYRYDPKNHQRPRRIGPPPAISGWISVKYSLDPPGVFVIVQAFGVIANVPVPRSVSVPDFVTTFAETPNPSGVDASRPLV